MPRIICTVTNDLSHDQRMYRICGTLAEAGYEVWLVGRCKRSSPPLPKQNFRQVRLNCKAQKGKRFYLEFNLRLLWFLLRRRADVINAVDLDTLLPGFIASRLRGVPLVFDAHEYYTETPEVVRRPRIQRLWESLAGFVLPRLRHAYTVGPELARLMGDRYGLTFQVVRNLPTRTTLPAGRPVGKIMYYQGMLNEGRGLETAIQAMHRLPGHELWLAGEGDLSQSLRELAAREGLSERVRFLGFIPPAELPELTRKAWLGLNLLENKGLSYYYSLANKAFDYIQAELPAVHMDFPEYRALWEHHGCVLLLDELAPEALANLVLRLDQEPDLYARVRDNCRKAAAELHWAREAGQILDIYTSLLQTDDPPA